MVEKNHNYTTKDHLQGDIISLINDSNQPKYIILEVLKLCSSEVKDRKEEN